MKKIVECGYDINKLNYDFGGGETIEMHPLPELNGKVFDTVDDCLEYVTKTIGTAYHKYDWNFEEDLDDKGNDGWVLHIIVEKGTMKFATRGMIKAWKKNDKPELVDLLANVFIEDVK